MIREDDFKAWLEAGGPKTKKALRKRIQILRTIERNLAKLGMPYDGLDRAWQVDRFKALDKRLQKMREDADAGGQDYRILMPFSEFPRNALSNWKSLLRRYGKFLAGHPPNVDY